MKEIVNRLHENRQIELAKSILEAHGYEVKLKESISVEDIMSKVKIQKWHPDARDEEEPKSAEVSVGKYEISLYRNTSQGDTIWFYNISREGKNITGEVAYGDGYTGALEHAAEKLQHMIEVESYLEDDPEIKIVRRKASGDKWYLYSGDKQVCIVPGSLVHNSLKYEYKSRIVDELGGI